jgi:hypothetical protein
MIVAHINGIPVEESVLQLAPAGAAMLTAVAVAGRAHLARLRQRRAVRTPGTTLPASQPRKRSP